MVIFYFTNLFPPIKTGSSLYTHDLVCHLSSKVKQIVVFTVNNGPLPESIKQLKNVEVVFLHSFTLPKLKVFMGFDACSFTLLPGNLKKVKLAMKRYGCDIIHQQSHVFDTSILSFIASRLLRKKRIITIHTVMTHPNKAINFFLSLIEKYFLNFFLEKNTKRNIHPDNVIKNYLSHRGLRQSETWLPYGIKTECSKNVESNSVFDKSIMEGKKVILSLGHLTAQRNRIDLIKAFADLVNRYEGLLLVIVGKVYYKEIFNLVDELSLKEKVIFVGVQNWHEINCWARCAVFEAHWIYDNISPGIATLEMMGLGLPVVSACSPDSYPNNLIIPDKTIALVRAGDVSDICRVFDRLLTNVDYRSSLGKRAKVIVKKELSWSVVAEKMLLYYADILTAVE